MTIQSELLALKGNKELLLAEEVWNWAKQHPESELHASITWNKEKAAYEHQLWQIRRLISIHVVFESGERRLVSLSIDRSRPGGGYRDMSEVTANKSLYEILLADALSELERVQARYEQVKQLEPIWEEVRKARKRHPVEKGGEKRASG